MQCVHEMVVVKEMVEENVNRVEWLMGGAGEMSRG